MILFTGRGVSGAWTIRAEQLGAAMGATVKPNADLTDCQSADAIVVVKRTPDALLKNIRRSGKPWALDVLDLYPQPLCTVWTKAEAIAWVRAKLRELSPTAIIWPNRKMREDCDIGSPGIVLKHHHRPDIKINPVREEVRTVGYEGSDYLGAWRPMIEAECSRRGWSFTVNPANLSDVDIVLALRDPAFSGYAQRSWKSNVKLANAHGSGTPFVGQPECGYVETASGCEYWAQDRAGLAMSFDWLESQSAREHVADRFRQCAYTVEQAAGDLRTFLETL